MPDIGTSLEHISVVDKHLDSWNPFPDQYPHLWLFQDNFQQIGNWPTTNTFKKNSMLGHSCPWRRIPETTAAVNKNMVKPEMMSDTNAMALVRGAFQYILKPHQIFQLTNGKDLGRLHNAHSYHRKSKFGFLVSHCLAWCIADTRTITIVLKEHWLRGPGLP